MFNKFIISILMVLFLMPVLAFSQDDIWEDNDMGVISGPTVQADSVTYRARVPAMTAIADNAQATAATVIPIMDAERVMIQFMDEDGASVAGDLAGDALHVFVSNWPYQNDYFFDSGNDDNDWLLWRMRISGLVKGATENSGPKIEMNSYGMYELQTIGANYLMIAPANAIDATRDLVITKQRRFKNYQ